jgi:hypothetical protein
MQESADLSHLSSDLMINAAYGQVNNTQPVKGGLETKNLAKHRKAILNAYHGSNLHVLRITNESFLIP